MAPVLLGVMVARPAALQALQVGSCGPPAEVATGSTALLVCQGQWQVPVDGHVGIMMGPWHMQACQWPLTACPSHGHWQTRSGASSGWLQLERAPRGRRLLRDKGGDEAQAGAGTTKPGSLSESHWQYRLKLQRPPHCLAPCVNAAQLLELMGAH